MKKLQLVGVTTEGQLVTVHYTPPRDPIREVPLTAEELTAFRAAVGVTEPSEAVTAWTQSFFVPATAMTPSGTNGAASGSIETANGTTVGVLLFDKDTSESAEFHAAMPASWDRGAFQYVPVWSATGGTLDQQVAWELQAKALNDGADPNGDWGTAVEVTDLFVDDNLRMKGAKSAAVTAGGSVTEDNCEVLFRVSRKVADDSLAVDAALWGVLVLYGTDSQTDA